MPAFSSSHPIELRGQEGSQRRPLAPADPQWAPCGAIEATSSLEQKWRGRHVSLRPTLCAKNEDPSVRPGPLQSRGLFSQRRKRERGFTECGRKTQETTKDESRVHMLAGVCCLVSSMQGPGFSSTGCCLSASGAPEKPLCEVGKAWRNTPRKHNTIVSDSIISMVRAAKQISARPRQCFA